MRRTTRARRGLRSVVVFPIFGLALLLPKLQILWWSLGRGVALLDPGHDPGHDFGHDPAFGGGRHDELDDLDEYTRLG